jgi:NAD(P)-dependent dehydrogenase (short-subunit alcohol dehydrogenase family)
VALITGAGSGMGREACVVFAGEGARVAALDVDALALDESAAAVTDAGGELATFVADVADEGQVRDVIEEVVARLGSLHILYNNAGVLWRGRDVSVLETDEAVWDRVFAINLKGMVWVCKYGVPKLIEAGGGAIVNISSMAGRRGLAYRIGYCSAKAGQVGMAYGLALELAPHNIRINVVAPGAVEGDRIDRVIAGQAEVRGVPAEQVRKLMVERSPLKRMVTADDITAATLFLCSEQARNISGQCVPVNAGEPAS